MQEYIDSFNTLLNNFYLNIKSDGYEILALVSDIDESIFEKFPLKVINFSGTSASYILLLNAIVSIIFICFFLKYILSLYSNSNLDNVYYFAVKIVIVVILATNSMYICKNLVSINYKLSNSITLFLEEISGSKIDYSFLEDNFSTIEEYFNENNKIGISGVKDLCLSSFILMMITFLSIRYVLVILCIMFCPVAILSILGKNTNKYFTLWCRIFIYSLLIQNINKVMIYILVVSKTEKDIYVCILIGVIFVMYRINKAVGEFKIYEENK